MPKVGDRHFSYSAKGKKAAKAYAEKSGKKVKKYQAGGEVGMSYDPFSTKNTKGVPAEKYAEEVDKANKMEELNKTLEPDTAPTANAQERSQTFQMGGNVLEYKEGGKVDITDVVKETEKSSKSFEPKSDEYADSKPRKAWPWSEPKRRTYGDLMEEDPRTESGGLSRRKLEGHHRKQASVRGLAKKALKGKKK